jgi:hypothetical protein
MVKDHSKELSPSIKATLSIMENDCKRKAHRYSNYKIKSAFLNGLLPLPAASS